MTNTPSSPGHDKVAPSHSPFAFIAERLWLDFVNTDMLHQDVRSDAITTFDALLAWMESANVLDTERASSISRRALQQPTGASAALVEARRVRDSLRLLAERGAGSLSVRTGAVAEINRILGRSAGTRRLELHEDGSFSRTFVPVGDAFAGLMIPIVESAADSMILGELIRVRRCGGRSCSLVFHDATRNRSRRWCAMAICGNRAKALRFRKKSASV